MMNYENLKLLLFILAAIFLIAGIISGVAGAPIEAIIGLSSTSGACIVALVVCIFVKPTTKV
jgi:uncharacterized membrane protein